MSKWRLLGELPQARSREELRAQSIAGWNPWEVFWTREDAPRIVVPDPECSSRYRHVPTYFVERDGSVMRFAADIVEMRTWRFYTPASPAEDGAFDAATARYEAHWRSSVTADEELPWPEPDDTWADRDSFLGALELVETAAEVVSYRGYSLCRICGLRNGSQAFRLVNWEWPEGFRHYVLEHRVRPSVEFERFVRQPARNLSRPGA